ncbi:hypothetical protein ID856_11735 [Xenorhabdus sp. 18]|uniref:hypothetical protein n=1 Tax=Xenorhabdus doucetiae TaxID=351671 RepID=UPI0019910A8C|nr:hypothetical protein [Xenorhabdus sp. 18]MBD2797203.1 hypothetical protein [Xenorhabdus sp. 18]
MSHKIINRIPAVAGWWFKCRYDGNYRPVIAWEIYNDGVIDEYFPVYVCRDEILVDVEYTEFGELIYNPTQIFTLVEDGLGHNYQPLEQQKCGGDC